MSIFKMADVSHVAFLYVVVDHRQRAVDGVRFVVKLWADPMYRLRDIAIYRFWQILLENAC